jgi:hypothetical protein
MTSVVSRLSGQFPPVVRALDSRPSPFPPRRPRSYHRDPRSSECATELRGQLLTGDKAVIEPAVDGRGSDSEHRCACLIVSNSPSGRVEAASCVGAVSTPGSDALSISSAFVRAGRFLHQRRARHRGQVRSGLSPGGRWIRTIGTRQIFSGARRSPRKFIFRNINRRPRASRILARADIAVRNSLMVLFQFPVTAE